MQEIDDYLLSEKSDIGYSEKAEKIKQETELDINQEKVDADMLKESEEIYGDLKKKIAAGEMQEADISAIKKSEKSISEAELEANSIDEMAKCFWMASWVEINEY